MAWDDEREYARRRGQVRSYDGEVAAGFYAEGLPESISFGWHLWKDQEPLPYRIVLDLFTPWDKIDLDSGHRWGAQELAKDWARHAVRVLTKVVQDYDLDHRLGPEIHRIIDAAIAQGYHDYDPLRPLWNVPRQNDQE